MSQPSGWPAHIRHAVAAATQYGTVIFMGLKL